jgi:hypothetical protein
MMQNRILVIVGLVLAAGGAMAQDKKPLSAAEMKTLTANGLTVSTMDMQGGKTFTGRVELAATGKLSGSLTPAGDKAIALSGTWKLKGAQLCRTLAPIQPDEVCETWLRTGAKEVTVQVDGKETSVNRWQ